MKKILMSLLALGFVAGLGVANAGEPSKEAVAKACKGKAEGTVVKVDGKEVKCPAPKK